MRTLKIVDTISVESYNHSCGFLSRTGQRSAGSISELGRRRADEGREVRKYLQTLGQRLLVQSWTLTAFPSHTTTKQFQFKAPRQLVIKGRKKGAKPEYKIT